MIILSYGIRDNVVVDVRQPEKIMNECAALTLCKILSGSVSFDAPLSFPLYLPRLPFPPMSPPPMSLSLRGPFLNTVAPERNAQCAHVVGSRPDGGSLNLNSADGLKH